MIRELKENYSYAKVITFLSVFTFIFGVAVSLVGEIFLPFASGFLASLILFENPDKRIFSLLCPVASIGASCTLIGFSALFGIEYVLLAFLLVACYAKSKSKAEISIYLTAIIFAFIAITLYINTAIAIGDFSADAVVSYSKEGFFSLRDSVITALSEFTVVTNGEAPQNLMSVEEATLYWNALTNSFISILVIFSFMLAGICEKIYSTIVLRYSKHGILKTFAHFIPSNLCAYAYILTVIVSMFVSDTAPLGISVINARNILLAVFLYMGLKYLSMVAKSSQKKLFIYALITLGFISFTSVASNVISYLGAWVVIGTNSHNQKTSD